MKKSSINSAAFLILTSASTLSLAAPVTDANIVTFTAGDPARAAEVNQNFTELKNTINGNDTATANAAAAHAADAAAHHSKYTDAEAAAAANAAVGTHAAVPDAHHTPYTDTEATAAADAAIVTHTGDAAAHHAEYTDAAAVSAIKIADGPGSTLDADLLDGLDSTAFASSGCPSDMAKVGSICIDIYEAQVTTTPTGSTTVNPVGNANCLENGTNCTAVYAQSLPGVVPSTSFTWFQAQQACANVGKRLPTNAEWQMAAAGTPNPVAGNECVVNGAGMALTGSIPGCASNFGVLDMVGNALEWVADWVPGSAGEATGSAGANFGGDRVVAKNATNQGTGTNMPAAILRGGSQFTPTADAGVFFYSSDNSPAIQSPNVGFRCAK